MAKTETPYKAIKDEITKAKNERVGILTDYKNKQDGYKAKLPAAEAAANEAAKGDNPKKFGDANRALTEIEDAILFYEKKIEQLENQPIFTDKDRLLREIKSEQERIEKEVIDELKPILTRAYEIARDGFRDIMDGNLLKQELGVDGMDYLSEYFYRPDEVKRYRDMLAPWNYESK